MFLRLFASALIALSLTTSVSSTDSEPYFPGITYDPAVPTVESVLGYASGEQITLPEDMWRYMEALKAYAPDKVKIFKYGKTWEGRQLIYLAISSAENIARLDAIDADMTRISDPRATNDKDAKNIIRKLPAPVWLAYSVHGNEISSTDAAMQTAYYLLAAENDPRVANILHNTIAFINPLQNPDGRARFVHRYRSALGLMADPDRQSAEHNEPWPSGRTNHYLFDMNRDWISRTQPETRGHIEALLKHKPIIFADLHEMGGDSTYYFAPEAIPYNPHLTKDQRENLFIIGRNNAKWFDKQGMSFFTREVFDAFYPGYGASWPAYYGSIATTYEQGSSRGRNFRRLDGTILTYKDTIKGHFTTSLSTLEAAANNRELLLNDYYDYQKTAISEGKADKISRTYILHRSDDPAGADKLARNLMAMGIEVMRAKQGFEVCRTKFDAGAYVIDSSQPNRRMIRTLLDPQVDMEPDFIAETERLRAKDYGHDIYDVTAWSLAKMYNVDLTTCGSLPNASVLENASDSPVSAEIEIADGSVVYLVPWGDMAAGQMLTKSLLAGLTVRSNDQSFTINGRDFPRGTLFFKKSDNPADLEEQLIALAKETNAPLYGTATTWVDKGRDLGSRHAFQIHPIKVAMVWDEPTSQYSAGNSRFVIERQMGYPVTAIRASDLSWADLSHYQVLILPQAFGSYNRAIGKSGSERIADWVSRGGVLIAQGNAINYLTHKDVNLLSAKKETSVESKGGNGKKAEGENKGTHLASKEDFAKAIAPTSERPDSVPGALVYADVDPDHFMTAGVKDTLNVLVRGSDIYSPITLDRGYNIVRFKGADDLLSSGYLWEENRKQLAFKPFVMVEPKGRGYVVAFTQEPTTRAYLDGLNILYMNAIFRGAGHARPLR